MTYGTRVVIPGVHVEGLVVDAPGGLGGTYAGAELVLDGTYEPAPGAAETIVLRIPPQPPIRQAVRLRISERSRGQAGGFRLASKDNSGLLALDLRVDTAQKTLHASLSYRYLPDVLPQDAVPVLRFCAALASGEQMAIADPGGTVFGTASGSFDPADWPRHISSARRSWPKSRNWPAPHSRCRWSSALKISGTWSTPGCCSAEKPFRQLERDDGRLCRPIRPATSCGRSTRRGICSPSWSLHQETLVVAGGHLPLGVVRRWMPAVRMSNLDDVRAWSPDRGTEGQ